MNEIFSFRKELNIKKIIILILIIPLIIGIVIWKLSPSIEEKVEQKIEKKIEDENPNTIFYSENKNISLELSKTYNFTQYFPTNNYQLELRNENNLNIFISEEKKLENQVLSEIVSADQAAYISNFDKYSNLSSVSEFDRNGNLAYTYCFHYLDSKTKTAYYLQTIWLETNENYYILDIEFPLDTLSENSKIINEILNSLTIN